MIKGFTTMVNVQRGPRGDAIFARLQNLGIKVNRYGYKHYPNKPNTAYRKAEKSVWETAAREDCLDCELEFAWIVYARVLSRALNN